MKLGNFLRTSFLQFLRTAAVATSEVYLVFSKEFRTKTGATVSNKDHIQEKKCICCHKNSEADTVGVLQKKVCNFIVWNRIHHYCEVFKNTYFEKHLWAAACENQHLSDKFRSSRPEVFCKKGVLRNFAKFAVKHLCQSLLFNEVAGLRLWRRCFPVNFVKFLRSAFFIEQTPLVVASANLSKGGNSWILLGLSF